MPAKNSVKTYIVNGFYHVYNRGVEKRSIFLDDQDYRVFLSYLKIYLSPVEETIESASENPDLDYEERSSKIYRLNELSNFYNKIKLICYVLMPNHFHLELQQIGIKDIENFMRCLITKYTMYFNKKYKRVGPLFQGRYKAVLILGQERLVDINRYIHLNPIELLKKDQGLESYSWSSYSAYIGKIQIKWLSKEIIMSNFSENITLYRNFILSSSSDSGSDPPGGSDPVYIDRE